MMMMKTSYYIVYNIVAERAVIFVSLIITLQYILKGRREKGLLLTVATAAVVLRARWSLFSV